MSAPLRWLVLATHVPPGGSLSGIVRYTTELIRALGAREDVLLDAVTTTAAAPFVESLLGGGRVHTVPSAAAPLLSLWERYAPLPQAGHDVVQGVKHLVPRRSPASALRVLTVHDMVLLDRPEDFGGLKSRLLPAPYRASLRQADLLLCVSAATAGRLAAHDPAAAARTAVVPLATAPALLQAEPVEVPVLRGRRFALVVGDSSPRKNLGAVVDAWSAVRAQAPDAVLAVAGPPSWGRSEQGAAYDALRRDGSLVALGRIPDAELRWCYEHAAVVLCPSLAEGFGLPAAEALDLGAAVIVSDDPALQEVAAGRQLATVPAGDHGSWARELVGALCAQSAGGSPPPRVTAAARTWADVAEGSVRAVRSARPARRTASDRT